MGKDWLLRSTSLSSRPTELVQCSDGHSISSLLGEGSVRLVLGPSRVPSGPTTSTFWPLLTVRSLFCLVTNIWRWTLFLYSYEVSSPVTPLGPTTWHNTHSTSGLNSYELLETSVKCLGSWKRGLEKRSSGGFFPLRITLNLSPGYVLHLWTSTLYSR